MTKRTLHNSFHSTEVTILLPETWAEFSEAEVWMMIQQGARGPDDHPRTIGRYWQERRIRRALCGMSNRHCGTVR